MIRIIFSDTDWVDSDSRVIKMSLENKLFLNSRLTHTYTAPKTVEDTWNGKTFPVQKTIWESYAIEFYIKELAINMLAKMQVCDSITVKDLTTNEEIVIDTRSSDSFTIEAGDRYETSGQSFNIICKSRKINIFQGISRNNTNNLQIIRGTETYNFYTDFEIISYITDSEKEPFDHEDGITYTARTISKNGKRMLFYFFESDAINLKKQIENVGYSSIKINPNTDNITVGEVGKCTLTMLIEGLWKCEAELIISPNLNFSNA